MFQTIRKHDNGFSPQQLLIWLVRWNRYVNSKFLVKEFESWTNHIKGQRIGKS